MSETAVMPAAATMSMAGNDLNEMQLLVDRVDLVDDPEQLPERKKVPNYFIDTHIFNKMAKNSCVEAQPSVLHFAGFTVGQVHVRKIKFVNVSSEVSRFHILAPETSFFKLSYQKRDRLVPGFAVECTVEFRPNEDRYYYDALRIHSKDENNNLIIPIHAFPVLGYNDFPKQIKFPVIPVGHHKTKIIPLRSRAMVEFEFTIKFVTQTTVFTIDPLEGIIPANGEVDIHVTFMPSDFVTAEMTFELNISQFNFKPIRCHVIGYSSPGLERQQVFQQHGIKESEDPGLMQDFDPRSISPLYRARRNRLNAGKLKKTDNVLKNNSKKSVVTAVSEANQSVEINGVKIPNNLDCPYNVSKVLTQKAGKMSMKELREVMERTDYESTTRQMEEAKFDQEVRQNVYEERQNQLRWQVKLGENPLTEEEVQGVLEERLNQWHHYKTRRGDPDAEDELNRTETQVTYRRTRRLANQDPAGTPTFDLYKNDMWETRLACRFRFAQAAWKVIVRKRADEKIASLRQLILDWGQGKFASATALTGGDADKKDDIDTIEEDFTRSQLLTVRSIGTISFPTHQSAQQIKKMEEATPPRFEPQPTRLSIKHTYSYEPLQVPQVYQLQHYSKMDVHVCSSGHVPFKTMRPLRHGADDEIIQVPLTAQITENRREVKQLSELEQEALASDVQVNLKPPAKLFQPIQYPPLHIFNPAPGLRVFEQSPPYLETDLNSHLCPLPRYGAQFFDKQHVIRGVTTWRKFPSPGLSTLSNVPTLSNVWVPRWTDPFNSDLLPIKTPSLKQNLDEDDAKNILEDDNEDEELAILTPEMVNAEFVDRRVPDSDTPADEPKSEATEKSQMFPHGSKMPPNNIPISENGLVPRWEKEKELDYYLTSGSNKLGQRIAARKNKIESLYRNKNLILK